MPISFGKLNGPNPGLFEGKIDQISIWDVALDSIQIQQYMNCPPSANEEGLVGFWNFEEGQEETVIDLSGNGNDGTISGATYSSDVPLQICQLTTVNGCDSIAILNLTINQPDTSFIDITACDSYEWNGQIYSESGTFTFNGNGINPPNGFTFLGNYNNSSYFISDSPANNWFDAYIVV